ncbi:anaerobic glycerol-3-phosphate dehydrogenase subunit C [Haloferax sp. AB510]|uniref:anaerobic glycerol-3-phosphate dehydrogenase subunit C n=1 Tax=Haloferax sp. AB510 TaxID=2934172 RepID=UPI00209BCB42|nr:anaerobic glycerol-3-phosphate dehydrogenase subunit C [Haloferax sp. AB510]MCO8265420.1 anaerobic glycerol-3-phosphate dehydrogenase subunit C [Haloferax sp. AB510]
MRPAGVVYPKSQDDIRHVVAFAREYDVSITARGAGSSLTGNAIGRGLIVDCSRHLSEVVDIDPDEMTATVQPGVVLDDLNALLERYGLYFAPDPSTSSTCTIGGMVANNAAGAHSIKHGTTRDNLRRVTSVLSDGTVAKFRRREGDGLDAVCERDEMVGEVHRTVRRIGCEYAEQIETEYPDLERNSSGYDLESSTSPDGSWIDLSKLFAGCEGTLGVITEVTLELTPRPETRAAALVFYHSITDAATAVASVRESDPSAVELMDSMVLDYARDAWELDLIPGDAGAALLVEVESTYAEQESDLDDVVEAAWTEAAVGVEKAIDDSEQDLLWTVRKASNPLLNRQPGDKQALSFIEDAAVPPTQLPEYIERVGDILREHNLQASVFGHAGQGVLHIKPFLNLKEEADRKRLRSVSEAVHEEVLAVGGSVSGEHGDGRLRSEHLSKMYSETLYGAFNEVKRTFDPKDVFNPGNVVPSTDGELSEVDADLRYEGYAPETVETALDFSEEEGFASAVEQCNGCSKCRTSDGGVMCPTYRATGDEIMSTRGRANMLREAINGQLGGEALTSDWFQNDVLDLCISCKGCETECPTGVDMSKLKTEAKHQKHEEVGVPFRARLFGNVRLLNQLGSLFAPIANKAKESTPVRILVEKVAGIDRRRTLPDFAGESFQQWFAAHEPHPKAGVVGTVALFSDCYMEYNHPEVGKAAVRIIESLGYAVEIPDVTCCGRAALSQGLVDKAETFAKQNLDVLHEYVNADIPVVGVEPSCVSAIKEYGELVDETNQVPEITRTVPEFLSEQIATGDVDFSIKEDVKVAFHGHCHSKAKGWDSAPVELLREVGYEVLQLDATCCGMAGSFGYEVEHYDLSMAIGDDLESKIDAVDADHIVTTGASCSQQLADRDIDTSHPLELLADQLN